MEYRKLQTVDKKKSKEAKELFNRIKPFAKLMTANDFEDFQKDILEELNCRSRIQMLQEWRANGITTKEDGLKYERKKQARITDLEKLGDPNSQSPVSDSVVSRNKAATTASTPIGTSLSTVPKHLILDHSSSNNDSGGKRRTTTVSDIQHGSDYRLLSPEEQQLYVQLKMYPKLYLAVKEVMFKELLRSGGKLQINECKDLLNIDPLKASKVYGFFLQQSWM